MIESFFSSRLAHLIIVDVANTIEYNLISAQETMMIQNIIYTAYTVLIIHNTGTCGWILNTRYLMQVSVGSTVQAVACARTFYLLVVLFWFQILRIVQTKEIFSKQTFIIKIFLKLSSYISELWIKIMSRRASFFARTHPGIRRVRFPDEIVFEESIKEADGEVIISMLRRASLDIDINRINMAGMSALHQVHLEDDIDKMEVIIT